MSLLFHAIIAISWFTPKPASPVHVRNCDHIPMTVYADYQLTIPLPDPFLSDRKGYFTFYMKESCAEVSVDGGNTYWVHQASPKAAK